MSSAKRYLVGSLLVAAMVGLSGASWAAEGEQKDLELQIKQSVVQQDLTAELTQLVNMKQQQHMSQLHVELRTSMDDMLALELNQLGSTEQESPAE